ncbi:hypothetical protein H2200_009339 [Cladophialophora chaetospira]|uniref:Xylanolytic transcriptional activator regulatory domain-containing protein n=1 Tax=Cladophialophora chaetospira TaxID=386627 RepID=A0AA38X3Z8_9EURO|nr:hypothetical protein H2200_009339 [Cladophialophora chaetospira]
MEASAQASKTTGHALYQGVFPQSEVESSLQVQGPGRGQASQAAQPAVQGPIEGDTDQPPEPSPSGVSMSSAASSYDNGYMERSTYIAPDKLRAEDGSEIKYILPAPSEATQQIANLQSAFRFPPRAIRDSLFENFWTYCYPWDPIVDRSQVTGVDAEAVSPLLLQTIFLAGSRMLSLSQAHNFASAQDYYTRAKTLFWLDYEKDPMTLLIASSLMHWWNPHGPERVSTNTSSFWCRITVSLAQQIGIHNTKKAVPNESLRRRLWWSIVARDCLISVAHGRPQAICLEDCDVPRPTVDDFPGNAPTGLFFIAYVELSLIMGRFAQLGIRRSLNKDHAIGIEDSLHRWAKTLPEQLRLTYNSNNRMYSHEPSKPYNLQSRQLSVLHLTTIILLYRSKSFDGPFPRAAVLAASTIAGSFEDFLARDEVRLLGPAFSFYLLAASIALLSCYKYADLWTLAQEDLKTLAQAQQEMKKKWPSALGSIGSFDKMFKLTVATQTRAKGMPESSLTPIQTVFFEDCDMTLCRMHSILMQKSSQLSTERDQREPPVSTAHRDQQQMINLSGDLSGGVPVVEPYQGGSADHPAAGTLLQQPPDPEEIMGFDAMLQDDGGQLNDAMGDWLFWNELAFDSH